MNNIQRLQDWFIKHCNGNWEHDSGISIVSCDNPGLWVTIDLKNTPLQNKKFEEVCRGVFIVQDKSLLEEDKKFEVMSKAYLENGSVYCTQEKDWIKCDINDGKFEGAGDPKKLDEILSIFLEWAETI